MGGGGDEFFRNSVFFFDQSSVLSICNNVSVNSLYGFAKLFKSSLNFSALSLPFTPFAEQNDFLMPYFPIYCVSFIALSVGRRLINMCHKRDSLDKCVHVSMKILDRGIQVVAAPTPSSEGDDTQMHKDVGGEILAGAAAPGECAICRIFSYL